MALASAGQAATAACKKAVLAATVSMGPLLANVTGDDSRTSACFSLLSRSVGSQLNLDSPRCSCEQSPSSTGRREGDVFMPKFQFREQHSTSARTSQFRWVSTRRGVTTGRRDEMLVPSPRSSNCSPCGWHSLDNHNRCPQRRSLHGDNALSCKAAVIGEEDATSEQIVPSARPGVVVDGTTARRKSALAADALISSQQLFNKCWEKVDAMYGEELIAPREIIWLNGPPGAGKGANHDFIKRIRGISRSITCSDLLLNHPPAKMLMETGQLVSDEIVGDALLQAIFDPDDNDGSGLIVDGFPRTPMQVELIKHLYDKLRSLYKKHLDDPQKRGQYPRPSFKVVVLYVDEVTSIERQMQRSKLAQAHNKKVVEAGAGTMRMLRDTDCSVDKCKYRYQVFRTHYPALVKLQQVMPFSIIDASASLEECEAQIAHELRYQSSLDLDEATYAAVTSIPLAREVVQAARQKLVQRLDNYCLREGDTFHKVLQLIQNETLPVIRKCSLSGYVSFSTNAPIFQTPYAVDIFIDILTDRGFCVSHVPVQKWIPRRFDVQTGEISCDSETTHRFRITFEKVGIRETAKKAEEAHKMAQAVERALLTASVIPEHLDHGRLYHGEDGHTRGVWRVEREPKPLPKRSPALPGQDANAGVSSPPSSAPSAASSVSKPLGTPPPSIEATAQASADRTFDPATCLTRDCNDCAVEDAMEEALKKKAEEALRARG